MNKRIKRIFTSPDRKEIASKSLVFVIYRVLGLILGYAFALLVTNYYGSAVYGLVTLSFTVFMILAIVGKAGMDLNLTRYTALGSIEKNDLSGLLNRTQLVSLALSATISALIILNKSYISREIFNKPQFEEYLFWAALTFPIWSLILIQSGFYRGLKKNTLFAIFNAFGRFASTLILLVAALFLIEGDIETMPVITHFAGLLVLLGICYYITNGRWGYPLTLNKEVNFRKFLLDSRPMLVSSLTFILLSWVDRIFIGIYLTEEDVAIYDIAAKLALLISFNLDAVNSILAPKVVEHFSKKDKESLRNTVRFTVGISTIISFLIFALLIVFQDFLLGLFGEEFKAGSWILIILGSGQLLNCLCGSVGIILQMTGHQRVYQKILLIGLSVNLILNFALVTTFGIKGVAFATFGSLIFWNILGVFYVKKFVGINSYFDPMVYILKMRKDD